MCSVHRAAKKIKQNILYKTLCTKKEKGSSQLPWPLPLRNTVEGSVGRLGFLVFISPLPCHSNFFFNFYF